MFNTKPFHLTFLLPFLFTLLSACQQAEETPSPSVQDAAQESTQIAPSGQQSSQPLTPMSQPRGDMVFYTLPNGHIMVVGQHDVKSNASTTSPRVLSSSEIYNPEKNEWYQYTPTPVPSIYHTKGGLIRVSDDQLVLLSDCDFAFYDLQNASWSKNYILYNEISEDDAPLSICIASQQTPMGDDQFLFFGDDANVSTSTAFLSLGQKSFEFAGEMSTGKSSLATVQLNDQGEILIAGGYGGPANTQKGVEIYNPKTQTWNAITPLNAPRSHATALLLPDGRVIVLGAHNYSDPAIEVGTLSNPHPSMQACTSPMLPSHTIEIYDPQTKQWTWGAALSCQQEHKDRWLRHALVLQDGRVMTLWADDAIPRIYNPQLDQWQDGTPLSQARKSGGALFQLADGRVIFAGGQTRDGTYLDIVENITP